VGWKSKGLKGKKLGQTGGCFQKGRVNGNPEQDKGSDYRLGENKKKKKADRRFLGKGGNRDLWKLPIGKTFYMGEGENAGKWRMTFYSTKKLQRRFAVGPGMVVGHSVGRYQHKQGGLWQEKRGRQWARVRVNLARAWRNNEKRRGNHGRKVTMGQRE